MKPKNRPEAGFTLIEMMIVVAIVGVLAAIAIPQFELFTSRSKRTEAYSGLRGIQIMETAYFSEYDTYTLNLASLVNLFMEGTGVLTTPKFYTTNIAYGSDDLKQGYAIGVQGNIDRDINIDFVVIVDGVGQSFMPTNETGYFILNDDLQI